MANTLRNRKLGGCIILGLDTGYLTLLVIAYFLAGLVVVYFSFIGYFHHVISIPTSILHASFSVTFGMI
jgi:hypothetical protein